MTKRRKTRKTFNLFRNEIVPAVFHDFIGYIPENGEGESVEGTVMSIARVDAWINSCINLLILKEYQGWWTSENIKPNVLNVCKSCN